MFAPTRSSVEELNISVWWKNEEDEAANQTSQSDRLRAGLFDVVIHQNNEPTSHLKGLSLKVQKELQGLRRNLENTAFCLVEAACITLDADADKLEGRGQLLHQKDGRFVLKNLAERIEYYRSRWQLATQNSAQEKARLYSEQEANVTFDMSSASFLDTERIHPEEPRSAPPSTVTFVGRQLTVDQRLEQLLDEVKDCMNHLERRDLQMYLRCARNASQICESLLVDLEVVSEVALKGLSDWLRGPNPLHEPNFERGRSVMISSFRSYIEGPFTRVDGISGLVCLQLEKLFAEI